MLRRIHIIALIAVLPGLMKAQSKWNGNAGDGLWRNPLNWTDNKAPILMPTQDIIFDNSIYPNDYIVKIGGSDSIIIHSLVVSPAPGKTITLLIDTSSRKSIALTVTSNAQGIVLENGGRFVNASGASSGEIISLVDSLRINNGGLFSQQTRRSHASLIGRLSRRVGTEEGVFEFNIPSASNTLSLSNQVYGTLRLSSTLYGNNLTYSGGAANPLNVRGNLEIGTGVTLSLNFSDTIFVKKNYIQQGGTINLANSTRNTIMTVAGDINQSAGVITKTGTALPELILNGNSQQGITVNGNISGNVIIRMNNSSGASLRSPLSIPYLLELKSGRIVSTTTNLLTLLGNSTIIADSTKSDSFVSGPLRKVGLSTANKFLFPVGKDIHQRWVCLKNVTGNFTVEFFRGDPHIFSTNMGNGIDHISPIEYWSIDADVAPAASANVELSYDPNSGDITDISTLRVAEYTNNGFWQNAGNIGTTGSAGAAGSVKSDPLSGWITGAKFTLAGSEHGKNTLPLTIPAPPLIPRPEPAKPFIVKEVFPRDGSLVYKVNADTDRKVWFELIDISGRRLKLCEQSLRTGLNIGSINNLSLSRGVYLLRLSGCGGPGKPPINFTYRFFVLPK